MSKTDDPDVLRRLYAGWSERMAANPEMGMDDMRSMFDEWHQATAEPEGVRYVEEEVGGVPGIWAIPDGADESKVVLYTHGGGFAVGSAASHRKFAGHLAKALGTRAFVVDYRRSPEAPFPAQLDDSVAVFRALVADHGIKPEDITTSGDSAGGNLAIAIPLKLRDDGDKLPGAVIAFSPWLDMEQTGATLDSNAATDALVQKPILQGMSTMFVGEGNDDLRTNPLANPLYADYAGFPRMWVDAGTHETLQDNAEQVHEKAKAAGVDSTLSLVDGQQHVFVFMAGKAKVADDELAAIAQWHKK